MNRKVVSTAASTKLARVAPTMASTRVKARERAPTAGLRMRDSVEVVIKSVLGVNRRETPVVPAAIVTLPAHGHREILHFGRIRRVVGHCPGDRVLPGDVRVRAEVGRAVEFL